MVTIIGAGLSGLIAANILTRRHRLPVRIIEAQPGLPNNHAALLRFRSNAVAEATGILFRKVLVAKGIYYRGAFAEPSIQLTNLYSYKVTGRYASRSIINTESCERWIAPEDLVARLADGLDIRYGYDCKSEEFTGSGPFISTMPMPYLMAMVGWRDTKPYGTVFPARPIWSQRATFFPEVDLFQTAYLPAGEEWPYRVSVTGRELICESMSDLSEKSPLPESMEAIASKIFGIAPEAIQATYQVREQHLGKIMPTDEEERRAFILAMTDKHQIYSLGRFATWRQILLDDIVQDVERIARWIKERNQYQRRISLWPLDQR